MSYKLRSIYTTNQGHNDQKESLISKLERWISFAEGGYDYQHGFWELETLETVRQANQVTQELSFH